MSGISRISPQEFHCNFKPKESCKGRMSRKAKGSYLMKKTSKMKMPSKSKMDPADNGKGFKKMKKGSEEKGATWTPPWAKKGKK